MEGPDDPREFALWKLLTDDGEKLDADDVSASTHNSKIIEIGPKRQWLVLTENEAEDLFREHMEEWADERLKECPEDLQPYIDREAFIDDLMDRESREMTLCAHDGFEYESEDFDGEIYFIYRI